MDADSFKKLRLRFTLGVALALLSLLVWQWFHGGVPSHSFRARADMPAISNWWGALTLPALTWFLTGRVQARLARTDASRTAATWQQVLLGFAGSLVYGAALATAFTFDRSELSSNLFVALPVIGALLPIHRAEYVLGFVLGMTYTFGAVLPTFIATVLSVVSALLYLVLRPLVLRGIGAVASGLRRDARR